MSVITISRQFGSGGDEIARQVSQVLEYHIFDKHMIREAAKASGLADVVDNLTDDVLDYSEDNHQVRGFLDILFGKMPVLPYVGVWPDDLAVSYTLEELRLQQVDSLRLVQKAIQSAYQVGNMVIVGRGGQVLLKDQPDVFHIRIVAPLEYRRQRIEEQLRQTVGQIAGQSATESSDPQAQAKELIAQRDAASADYLQSYYHARWDDPLLYHLVLNTGKMSMDQAVQIIVKLAQPHPMPAL